MKSILFNFFTTIFTATLVLFILVGFIIVFGQIFGIIIGNGIFILKINSLLKQYAIIISTISGFCGFFAYYLKNK